MGTENLRAYRCRNNWCCIGRYRCLSAGSVYPEIRRTAMISILLVFLLQFGP